MQSSPEERPTIRWEESIRVEVTSLQLEGESALLVQWLKGKEKGAVVMAVELELYAGKTRRS